MKIRKKWKPPACKKLFLFPYGKAKSLTKSFNLEDPKAAIGCISRSEPIFDIFPDF